MNLRRRLVRRLVMLIDEDVLTEWVIIFIAFIALTAFIMLITMLGILGWQFFHL